MIFILKLTINMELIDTPNPNAKKIETDVQDEEIVNNLNNIDVFPPYFWDLTS